MDYVRGDYSVRPSKPQLNNGISGSRTGFWCRIITNGSLLSISAVRLMCILPSCLLQLCASNRHTCLFKKHSASIILTKAGQSMYSRGSGSGRGSAVEAIGRVYCPIALLPPGHDPGADCGVASTARQRGRFRPWDILDRRCDPRVAAGVRRRGVASARAIATRSDESRPPALAASERTQRGAVRIGPARPAPSVAQASVS